MRGRATLPTLLVTLAALGACAPRPAGIVLTPQAAPAGTDGRYRGTARLVRGDRSCPRSGPRVYDLENGTVTLAYSGNSSAARRSTPARVQLSATVQSDGRLQGSDGVGTIDGQLRDGTLEFTISSAACEHFWSLRHVR